MRKELAREWIFLIMLSALHVFAGLLGLIVWFVAALIGAAP